MDLAETSTLSPDMDTVRQLYDEFMALSARTAKARRAFIAAHHAYWRARTKIEPLSRKMWTPSRAFGRAGEEPREVEVVDFYAEVTSPNHEPLVMVKEIKTNGQPSQIIAHAELHELS